VKNFHVACLLLLLALVVRPAVAAIEELEFSSPEQEERYLNLIDEMRCPKCLNANLSGSDAPIAADLRAEIHAQITAGNSDDEIIEFMTARYGDFIMYRPPLNIGTALLWFGPLVLLLAGFVVIRRMLAASSSSASTSENLSAEERKHLDQLLAETPLATTPLTKTKDQP
jgi:cytochrome c-type biogenesis protein CcmH